MRWFTNGYAQAVRYMTDLYGVDYLGRTWAWPAATTSWARSPCRPTSSVKKGRQGRCAGERAHARVAARLGTVSGHHRRDQGLGRPGRRVAVEVEHKQGNWMARDPKGRWLATLLNTFGDTTGLARQPVPRRAAPPPS